MDPFIPEVIAALAKQRPIFHSEADFQHALAWQVHERLPSAKVRLERPVKLSGMKKRIHVDVWVEKDGEAVAVELKYKTAPLQTQVEDEEFVLLNKGAQDLGRYDFIKDIRRVEDIVAERAPRASGYAVLLTNDPSYWAQPRSSLTVDAEFRLQEGRSLHGTLDWGPSASAGTKRGREQRLPLTGTYPLRWEDYSLLEAGALRGKFRCLVVEVEDASAPFS